MIIALLRLHWVSRTGNEQISFWGNSRKVTCMLFGRSLTGFWSSVFCFLSMEKLPVGNATVLNMLSNLFSPILAAAFLSEPWKRLEALATLMSLVGSILVAKPQILFGGSDHMDPIGVGYSLLAAAVCSIVFLQIRMLGTTHKVDWGSVNFVQALGQILLSVPSMYMFGERLEINLSNHQILLVCLGGIVGSLSQLAMNIGMQREKSATATAMLMSDVLFGFIWQALFTSDPVDMYSVLGAFLVSGSILLIIVFNNKSIHLRSAIEGAKSLSV